MAGSLPCVGGVSLRGGDERPKSALFDDERGKSRRGRIMSSCFEYCDFRLFRLVLTSTELRSIGAAS